MPKGVFTNPVARSDKIRKALMGHSVSKSARVKIGKSSRGRYFSETARERMSLSHMGNTPWIKGKHHTDITKKKISKAFKGKKHPNWKGGITPENIKIRTSIEYELWRNSVLARDNWTCQKTGIRGKKLRTHHIQNFAQYPELRFAIDNGITLSEESHLEFHQRYGKLNNTKEQLEEFLNKNI